MALSEELLDILACPKCKGDIYLNDTKNGLICENCKLLYEIRDDIPIMLIDEANPIDGQYVFTGFASPCNDIGGVASSFQ